MPEQLQPSPEGFAGEWVKGKVGNGSGQEHSGEYDPKEPRPTEEDINDQVESMRAWDKANQNQPNNNEFYTLWKAYAEGKKRPGVGQGYEGWTQEDFRKVFTGSFEPKKDYTTKTGVSNETKKPKLTEQEKACQEFVERHKKPAVEVLTKLVKEKQFILVGEEHHSQCEPMRHEIAIALAKLQKEGLTHIALESRAPNQTVTDSLDYTDPKIKEKLREKKLYKWDGTKETLTF